MTAIRFEIQNLPRLRRQLGSDLVEKAVATALRRVAMKARTTVSKEVRERYTIKARDLSQTVRLRKLTSGGHTTAFRLDYRGPALPLDKFGLREVKVDSARGPRRGVTVQVKKAGSRKRVKRAFPVNLHGKKAFIRTGSSRLPIRRPLTISIPQMVARLGVQKGVSERVRKETPIEFDRAMRVAIDRALRK